MKMTQDFISGYASAVANLGSEGDYRHADWSAPFKYLKERLATFQPIGVDIIERLRQRRGLCADAADEIERLRAALEQIRQWSKAYPVSVFPTPDIAKVRELLEAGGITLDSVSADAMRRVVEGVGKIASDALSEQSGSK